MRRARDTSEKAAAIQFALNRAAGPERRVEQVLEMSEFVFQLARAGMKARHPEYDDAQVRRALLEQLYPDILTRRK
ncbi:MAG TPA: hypothetical protein VF618_15380 [Thermoanaerobaculia bacterium]